MLSRKTDTTLVLLAAPSHTGKLHSVALRAVCRDSSLHESTSSRTSKWKVNVNYQMVGALGKL
jgi:hypothetical protein